MRSATDGFERREQRIAALLWYGTWCASALIAVGILVGIFQRAGGLLGTGLTGYQLVKAGVAVFILLPIARVTLMLTIFLRERDYVYVLISGLVLAIIAAGILMRG
jgi:hypothetical protein